MIIDYWFKIEPYVYVNIVDDSALLYNTLDGVYIEIDEIDVIELLREVVKKENSGVVFLESERYYRSNICCFIDELRDTYMGDVIDVRLSNGKPIQILPYFDLLETQSLFKKHSFAFGKKILRYLSEVTVFLDDKTSVDNLISYLETIPSTSIVNVRGKFKAMSDCNKLLFFLNQLPLLKKIIFYYADVIYLQSECENLFSYSIEVDFPVDMQQWIYTRELFLSQNLPIEYIFKVSSSDEYQQAKALIEEFCVDKYQLKPVYTGDNMSFFEENVFLSKEDILSTHMSSNDFFVNQSMNIYDFGKINIMPDGEIYANVNYPALGNIGTHSIYDIISKELEEGKSWLRIRNQTPCNTCIYQWNCPSPSDYEIEIGRSNLCLVK